VIESKYIKKFPWQLKFEEKMKDNFPDAEIAQDELNHVQELNEALSMLTTV